MIQLVSLKIAYSRQMIPILLEESEVGEKDLSASWEAAAGGEVGDSQAAFSLSAVLSTFAHIQADFLVLYSMSAIGGEKEGEVVEVEDNSSSSALQTLSVEYEDWWVTEVVAVGSNDRNWSFSILVFFLFAASVSTAEKEEWLGKKDVE